MRTLGFIAAAMAFSTLLYVAVYWFALDFPLRFAFQGAVLEAKERYAAALAERRKLVIISGSNSLFGIECARIEEETGVPCVNGGTANTFDIFYTINRLKPHLRSGDVVYMPLEYNIYIEHTSPGFVGREALIVAMRERKKLREVSTLRAIHTLFYLDLAMALRAAGEMIRPPELSEQIRKGSMVNRNGDFRSNSEETARKYRWRTRTAPSYVPRFNRNLGAMKNDLARRLGGFLDWCRERNITVVGGLPVFFDDTPVSDEAIETLRSFFARHGGRFLLLANRSQYPRRLFFDREAHLNETGRRIHTRRVLGGLRRMGLLPDGANRP